jgi:signal peptidase I
VRATAEEAAIITLQDASPAEAEGGDGQGESRSGPPPARPRSRHAGKSPVVEWLVVVVVALVAALMVKTFAVQAFVIPSQSMEPTLLPGDRVLVDKLAKDFGAVTTGDVIVFRHLPRDHSPFNDLIKRVIAGPGQSVYVANCKVFVNGKELEQPYLPTGWQNTSSEYCTVWDGSGMLDLPDPYTVPAGHYFVMGDNRRDSDDSRFWGPVPASYIVGVAFVRMWPPSRLGPL